MPKKSNTRSAQGAGTIRKRADGRWEARYTLGRDPATGKQMQRSVYGATQKEVREKLQRIAVDLQNGEYTAPSKLTVLEWAETWLNEYCTAVKESTKVTYQRQIANYIVPMMGAKKLCDIRPHDVQKVVNTLFKGTESRQTLSAKSVKLVFGTLHRMLEQAKLCGYIKQNPADNCNLPRCEKPDIKPLDENAIGKFLVAIKGDENEYLFVTDLFTGLRKSELLGLTWDCIDFEKGTIRIYRQLQFLQGEYKFSSLKNGRPRMLMPSRFVLDALRSQRKRQAEQQLMAGSAWSNPDGFVFTNGFGRHLLHQSVFKQFKRIAARIGMPDARFHDLRHSYAVEALKNGDPVKTVQEALGHATAAFTLDLYGHVTDEMRQESAARMDAAVERILARQAK